MASGLKDEDIEKLQVLMAVQDCELASVYSPRVTYLVVRAKTGSVPLVAQKRTMKYIQAVVNRVPIVRAECTLLIDWLINLVLLYL